MANNDYYFNLLEPSFSLAHADDPPEGKWKETRRKVILRDNGCDLGIEDRPISKPNKLLIHHLNPITIEQVENMDPTIFDPNNLITVSYTTHNAIHYGDIDLCVPTNPTERTKNDTNLW